MRFRDHVLCSAVFSGVLHLALRRWELTLASFLAGVFIDLDHLFDYFVEFGWPLRMDLLFRASYEDMYPRTYVPAHAWEWAPLVWLAAWASGWSPWVTGTAAGWTQHMVLDQLANGSRWWAYFLTGRWAVRFHHFLAFPKKEV